MQTDRCAYTCTCMYASPCNTESCAGASMYVPRVNYRTYNDMKSWNAKPSKSMSSLFGQWPKKDSFYRIISNIRGVGRSLTLVRRKCERGSGGSPPGKNLKIGPKRP